MFPIPCLLLLHRRARGLLQIRVYVRGLHLRLAVHPLI